MTRDRREDIGQVTTVHKASGFRHLDGVWKLIVEIAVATRHSLPGVYIQFSRTHFLNTDIMLLPLQSGHNDLSPSHPHPSPVFELNRRTAMP